MPLFTPVKIGHMFPGPNLTLHVKKQFFDQILSGEKTEEYREKKSYWTNRLLGQYYNNVIIACGYPSKADPRGWLIFPYNGFREVQIESHCFLNPGIYYVIELKNEQHRDVSQSS